ncbi:MAG: hypothetical protein ACKODC_05410, partial [Limnohabitans sp.]
MREIDLDLHGRAPEAASLVAGAGGTALPAGSGKRVMRGSRQANTQLFRIDGPWREPRITR